MGQQAMGIPALNYRNRFDAFTHVLTYVERPLVSTYMSKYLGSDILPTGQNVVVAIMIYSGYNQEDSNDPWLSEESAYPASPDSEYGWEKLFSERLWMSFARNYGLRVRIARLHNVYGPLGSWNNGREKAPAAMCRKVMESDGQVEVWGPGTQTRSFLYIDECVTGIHKIQQSNFAMPLNLGSDRMISINELVQIIANIAKKSISIKNIPGPQGVMGRTSHNKLIKEIIGWCPQNNLEYGLQKTYEWICATAHKNNGVVLL
jgi:nucleoside-diphosphate-sugar epimerase